MSMLDTIKQNPFKTISLVITIVSTLGAGSISIDNRYVHAGTFEEYQKRMTTEFESYKGVVDDKIDNTVKQIDNLRVKQLQDKIFELNFLKESGKARAIDKALLDRYRNELQQMDNQ